MSSWGRHVCLVHCSLPRIQHRACPVVLSVNERMSDRSICKAQNPKSSHGVSELNILQLEFSPEGIWATEGPDSFPQAPHLPVVTQRLRPGEGPAACGCTIQNTGAYWLARWGNHRTWGILPCLFLSHRRDTSCFHLNFIGQSQLHG